MASEVEPAKRLLPYLQRADELQKHEPLVAYYCITHLSSSSSSFTLLLSSKIDRAEYFFFFFLMFWGVSGRLYAMEKGLIIPPKERTKTTNSILVSLMNQLEKVWSLDFFIYFDWRLEFVGFSSENWDLRSIG